jgi:hypothetical protein
MSKASREYVLIPKDEYDALTKLRDGGAVDAVAYARASLARDLPAGRKGRATQAEPPSASASASRWFLRPNRAR